MRRFGALFSHLILWEERTKSRPMGGGLRRERCFIQPIASTSEPHLWLSKVMRITKAEYARVWGFFFHLILSSPPFSEEGKRHKVSGQTVLLPQTQVGLGDKRGWSNFRARGRRYKVTGQTVLLPQTQVGLADNRGWSNFRARGRRHKATRQREDLLKSSQCQQSWGASGDQIHGFLKYVLKMQPATLLFFKPRSCLSHS